MSAVVRRHIAASPDRVWAAVSDFAAHAALVPFTTMLAEPGEEGAPREGWRFITYSRLGPLLLEDRMRLIRWEPPTDDGVAYFHAQKVGPVLGGWASVQVHGDRAGGLTTVIWDEHIRLLRTLPGPLDPLVGLVADASSKILFGWVLDRILTDPAHRP